MSLVSAAQRPDSLTAPSVTGYQFIENEHALFVSGIRYTGNNITRSFILQRELLFKTGDTILPGTLGRLMDRSRQNLLNASLFNFAEIYHYVRDSIVEFEVKVVERWYVWPVPFFEIAETNFNTWWLTRDFRRTIYGMFLSHDNFRGRKETLRLKIQLGYTHQYALQYNIPYINKARTIGAGFTGSYYSNKEIVYGTTGNKRDFYSDKDRYVREEWYARLLFTYRKRIYNTHSFQLRYNGAKVNDTIVSLRPDYFVNRKRTLDYFNIGYSFVRDRRDFKAYPLRGYLLGGEVVHSGLGILDDEPSLTHFYAFARKYFHLSDLWYFALSSKSKVSAPETQPYYLQGGLGYGDLVRGYEYYIIDGQHWTLFRSNLKYRLLKPTVQKFGFIPSEKFNTFHYALYLNVFGDAGYVSDNLYHKQNPLANKWLAGYGIGLDFVTYYDWILRLELSRNRLGETGFFVNFNAPI